MGKEILSQTINSGVCAEGCSPIRSERSSTCSVSRHSIDKDGLSACRVCQCTESDKRGDAALDFLCITPTLQNPRKRNEDVKLSCNDVSKDSESNSDTKDDRRDSRLVEFVSPNGEVFVCNTDIEMGFDRNQDKLIELGCSCKNDLGLVHYACALKWFVNHGSTICEICGCVAKNIRTADLKKVVGSLKEYETLRERTANGVPNPAQVQTSSGVDPDALAAIRRQRLSEIALWFGPHNNNSARASQVVAEQVSNIITEEAVPAENPATKWAVEGTGILLATGLLTVTLAWLIAPRVGKKTAKSGLHILLGGICALTVVVFIRFVGRMADQFANPRSNPFEEKDSVKLSSYRGDNVNEDAFDLKLRTPDPQRLINAYCQFVTTFSLLRAFSTDRYTVMQRITLAQQIER